MGCSRTKKEKLVCIMGLHTHTHTHTKHNAYTVINAECHVINTGVQHQAQTKDLKHSSRRDKSLLVLLTQHKLWLFCCDLRSSALQGIVIHVFICQVTAFAFIKATEQQILSMILQLYGSLDCRNGSTALYYMHGDIIKIIEQKLGKTIDNLLIYKC